MALRFFADHCVSNQIIDALREAGHEVVRLKGYLQPSPRMPLLSPRPKNWMQFYFL